MTLTGHFQSFFYLFFFNPPPDPKSEKKIPLINYLKNSSLM